MTAEYFGEKQKDIVAYKDYLDKHNIVIDKTNKMFLNLILDILNYLGTQEAHKLDEECEYNVMTMKKEFEDVIYSTSVNEKAQATLLIFFLRIAKEMEVKYSKIENDSLARLYSLITSKDFKLPSYIKDQREFALENMPDNIKRMLYMKS